MSDTSSLSSYNDDSDGYVTDDEPVLGDFLIPPRYDSTHLRSFDFHLLPTEIKYEIVKQVVKQETATLFWLCFAVLPALKHTEADGRSFEVTVKDILRWNHKEATGVFTKQYVLDRLFPDGVLGFDGREDAWWMTREAFVAIDVAQDDDEMYAQGISDITAEDYYQLRFIYVMQSWEARLHHHTYKGHGNAVLGEWGDGHTTFFRLSRFLGAFDTSMESNLARLQSRYNFLGTLTVRQRKQIDALLDAIVESQVRKFWDKPPQANSKLNSAYHHISTSHIYPFDLFNINMVAIDFDWKQFTRSGAYGICLKHLLLSISDAALLYLFCESEGQHDADVWFSQHRNEHHFLQMWQEEIFRTRWVKNLLAVEAPTDFFGRPTGTIVLRPQQPLHDRRMSMGHFVLLNPVWAWQQALELPVGEPLDVGGFRPAGARTGMFSLDRYADTHPEWELECFGDEGFELGSFFDLVMG